MDKIIKYNIIACAIIALFHIVGAMYLWQLYGFNFVEAWLSFYTGMLLGILTFVRCISKIE